MAGNLGPQDVLFMGMGRSHVAWYRCFLPALALKADWVGYGTAPPTIHSSTGYVRGGLQEPDYNDYKIIVIQQPRSKPWVEWIVEQQAKGTKVIYEVDDDLHCVGKMKTHTNGKRIGRVIKGYELAMRACDGIIVSTPHLAKRLAKFNKNVWVCEVGIDMERYNLVRSKPNNAYTIGFAGGIGHEVSLAPWLDGINTAMTPETRFINVGVDYSDKITSKNVLAIPFSQVESWPSVLSNFSVLLAPGGNNGFFRAKSELKWIEASAMGIPLIANPVPYRSIEHGKTGLCVTENKHVKQWLKLLINDPDLGLEIGQAARERVLARYHINNQVEQWIKVFEEIT